MNSNNVNVFDALEMMSFAWGKITETTVKNCFQKTGFVTEGDDNSTSLQYYSEDDPEDDIPLARLSSLGLNQQTARDFLILDLGILKNSCEI